MLPVLLHTHPHRTPTPHHTLTPPPASGRLEDKSSLVRKEALRLLQALMLHNPFGPTLPVDRFEASLATHRGMLEQLAPPDRSDALQAGIQVEAAPAGGQGQQEEQAEGQEEAAVKAEGEAEGMEVDGAAAAEAPSAEAEVEEEPAQPARSREYPVPPRPCTPVSPCCLSPT